MIILKLYKGELIMDRYCVQSHNIQDLLSDVFSNATQDEDVNKVILSTNLKRGLPVKDIHKIAGPLTDEWVYQVLNDVAEDADNKYGIYDVQSKDSSSLDDVSIRIKGIEETILIDVKSASLEKGDRAGKSSNLTSFRKIRPHYIENPESIFLILSIKNGPFIEDGIRKGFEMTSFNIFDIKLVKASELKFNTAMGDQFQIGNSMKVTQIDRSTADFIELIDSKYMEKYSKERLDNLIANNYVTPTRSKSKSIS